MTNDNLPLEKALKRILSVGGFTFKKIEDFYLVGAADPRNPAFGLLSTTATIKINYLKASEAANTLNEHYNNFIKANDVINTIVVTGSSNPSGKCISNIPIFYYRLIFLLWIIFNHNLVLFIKDMIIL